ncbi:head decoration protein [Rhodoferax sp. AJA081-3]|uniref:head decoration protein n=1 Tax=Rhodoferax sp. AJA081-3 TaxID=2752316 RepID=UPI001AE062E6|nr:head decoration protein [Rhodoferax sp. AJA081-3]QTN29632.1 head decoration protein [Rhodoferax sp. AJA081-3]
MNVINEALNLGDLVKYEQDSLNYSRDVVTVEAGQNLPLGCIVGRVTATAKVKQLDPGAEDGSHFPVGILLGAVDATLIDREDALILARHGVVASKAVVWPVEISTDQQAAITAQLASLGILIRQSA